MAGELDTVYVYAEEVVDAGQTQLAGGRVVLGDVIYDDQARTPEEEYLVKERAEEIDRALGRLTPEEAEFFDERFGISTGEPQLITQIAANHGVSYQVAQARINKAGSKLRHPSNFHLLNPDLLA
ncbi:MAG TPA: hypothetical protein VG604_02605 [Candidatus Saccharimonadales bacterium]|nr:hypothetical protein [Candidatus Saccharimonadales bacterium]